MLILAGLAITVLGVLVGEALNFGGMAWILTLIVVMLGVSVVDRERFYGPRTPNRR